MFTISEYYRVKTEKEYPWPCASEPNRMLTIYTDDVLTKDPKLGTYMKHTGLGTFGHVIPDEDLEFVTKPINLKFI